MGSPIAEERCVDCHLAAPPITEEETLRSTKGWRLTFERAPDGTIVPTWRCPACWTRKKAQQGKP